MKYLKIFENETGVEAFFTTKYGAVKGRAGGTVFDNPPLFEELGLSDTFKVWPKQIHKTDIAAITEEDVRKQRQDGQSGIVIADTDGTVTNVSNVLLTSVHADCLPVYFYDEAHHAIGLVHAGWRGAAAGIAPKAVEKMVRLYGSDPARIKAALGPCISSCCFEVGAEVPEQFFKEWGDTFAVPVRPGEGGAGADKYLLDLKAAVRRQLTDQGLRSENIAISSHCTCCEPGLFCSYRREGGTYERMGAGICMRGCR